MGAAGVAAMVYIVDDEPSVRQGLVRLVQSAGMRAEGFRTVNELLGLERIERPACVIADIRMPETSGLEIPQQLATQGRPLPVIVVTAQDTEQDRAAARHAGAVAFFHKPVDGQALLDAIAWAVEASQNGRRDVNPNDSVGSR